MELKDYYYGVVIGSGPAGVAAAKALSGSGLGMLIVERDKLLRYKMCSGIEIKRGQANNSFKSIICLSPFLIKEFNFGI
ncbi:MAG: hypothetical protein H8D67_07935 [Deltaproteobacteria bacterium]|nr:hypothetical protein [Deltaproteobacteria bacterium]MBL7175837.1 hypothetical protein [Desulfobacteraceae bacterium]